MEVSFTYKLRVWLLGTCIFWGIYFIGTSLANIWEYGTTGSIQVATARNK